MKKKSAKARAAGRRQADEIRRSFSWLRCNKCGLGYSSVLRKAGDACGDCSGPEHLDPSVHPCDGIVWPTSEARLPAPLTPGQQERNGYIDLLWAAFNTTFPEGKLPLRQKVFEQWEFRLTCGLCKQGFYPEGVFWPAGQSREPLSPTVDKALRALEAVGIGSPRKPALAFKYAVTTHHECKVFCSRECWEADAAKSFPKDHSNTKGATMGVKLYKDGNVMAIETDAENENEFIKQVSAAFAELIERGSFQHDWSFQFQEWLPQVCEVVCKLRGYKSEVRVRHLIVAGEIFPNDKPKVCVAIGKNGEPIVQTDVVAEPALAVQ